jgi:hypothetical protein
MILSLYRSWTAFRSHFSKIFLSKQTLILFIFQNQLLQKQKYFLKFLIVILIIYISLFIAQASVAENFNGGITLFNENKVYGIFLNMGV